MNNDHAFHRVIEYAPFGFHRYRLAEGDRLVFEGANPAADAILKVRNDAFIGLALEDAFPALAQTRIPLIYRQLARAGGVYRWEQVDYRDQQIVGVFEVVAFQTAPGEIAVAFTDITARRQTEQQLRQSEEKFARIFLSTPDAVGIVRRRDGVLLDVNPGFEAITGYGRSEALGRSAQDLGLWMHPADQQQLMTDLRLYGQVLYRDLNFRRRDGAQRIGRFSVRPLRLDRVSCLLFIAQDITERRRAKQALEQREQLLQAAASAMAQLLSHRDMKAAIGAALATLGQAVNADRAYLFENQADAASGAPCMSQRYEWCAATATAQIDNPALQNLSYQTFSMRWHDVLASGQAIQGPVREFPAGERPILEAQAIRSLLVLPIHIEGAFWGFIGFDDCQTERIWTPVEEQILRAAAAAISNAYLRMRAEETVRTREAQYQLAVRAGQVGVWDWNLDTGEMRLDPQLKTMLGYRDEEIRNHVEDWGQYVHPDDRERVMAAVDDHLTSRTAEYQIEHRMLHRDGGVRWFLARGVALRRPDGQPGRMIGTDTDITELHASRERIEYLACYDPLTNLPNRTLLAQRADLALAMAAQREEPLAVLLLDLDHFKEVNDSLGHAEGDQLLVQAAARLQVFIRETDTLCRLGGDEFVLLLPSVDQQGALQIANKALTAFRQPFQVGGHSLNLSVSVGIALYPHNGADFNELLKNADAALFRAKHRGRNTQAFYDRAMNVATFQRLILEAELHQAIQMGQLRAYFQPKVRLSDGALVGAEALVRWHHPERGLVPPGQFIPVAETSDLIVELGEWMLDAVCRQLAAWRQDGLPPLVVAVNLAARHFHQPDVVGRIENRLAAHGLTAQTLELELTESTLLETGPQTAVTLQALERLGIGLSIDDFGTGYSSLNYLKRLPLSTLKIDQSFVRDLVTDPDDQVLAATIVALGHGLGLAVVAEGVETEAQRRLLLQQGCDFAQGYLFSPAIPAEEFAAQFLFPLQRAAPDMSA